LRHRDHLDHLEVQYNLREENAEKVETLVNTDNSGPASLRSKGAKGLDLRVVWWHVRKAQETIKGENQLAEYVARLDPARCAEILLAGSALLPSMARHSDECRIAETEQRGFEEVIRTWTLHILSRIEGG
jgi:hypothetical protein